MYSRRGTIREGLPDPCIGVRPVLLVPRQSPNSLALQGPQDHHTTLYTNTRSTFAPDSVALLYIGLLERHGLS